MIKLNQPFASAEPEGAPDREPIPVQTARGFPAERPAADDRTCVLAIDDDPDLLENLADSLKPAHFRVETTGNSEEFYRHLESFPPDVVITDLQMPSEDGIDILKGLRDRSFSGDIILMSGTDGHILETARRVAVSYGLNIAGVLRKPFTPKQLHALVAGNGAGGENDDERVANALSQRRIRPYYQPKIDLKTGAIVGAEALSRWYHPERGLLMPDSYLKGKRATSRKSLHDYTIFERAMEFCAKLNSIGQRMKVAVNFSADVVLSNEFMTVVADAQRRYGLTPDQLVVELTEHDTTENYDELAERLLKLRLFGAHLAIDDFGVGHSSLSRIQHLPVSEIKIDRSFVSGLGEYSDNIAIVRSIIELARSVHCAVCAEGVETLEALDILRTLGCDMAQGHLFSPAVNDSTFVALVRDKAFTFLQPEENSSSSPPA
jgi:EAL domain-containing protein (putative c-di-GMP-specific phosphodiesterase class I)